MGSLSLVQMIFPTQGSNPGPPALWVDSSPAEPQGMPKPQGKPKDTRVGSLFLLQQSFLTQELNRGLLYCRWILYQLSYQGSPVSPNSNLFPSIILTQSNKCLNGHHVYQVSLVHSFQKKKKTQKKYSRHCIPATVSFNTLQWFIIVLRIKAYVSRASSHIFSCCC